MEYAQPRGLCHVALEAECKRGVGRRLARDSRVVSLDATTSEIPEPCTTDRNPQHMHSPLLIYIYIFTSVCTRDRGGEHSETQLSGYSCGWCAINLSQLSGYSARVCARDKSIHTSPEFLSLPSLCLVAYYHRRHEFPPRVETGHFGRLVLCVCFSRIARCQGRHEVVHRRY